MQLDAAAVTDIAVCVASEVKEKYAIASWKRRRSLITYMDALVADVRDDVWRRKRRERVGRLNATTADVQALTRSLSRSLLSMRLIKSIAISRMSSTFILRSGVDTSACRRTDDLGRGDTDI